MEYLKGFSFLGDSLSKTTFTRIFLRTCRIRVFGSRVSLQNCHSKSIDNKRSSVIATLPVKFWTSTNSSFYSFGLLIYFLIVSGFSQ